MTKDHTPAWRCVAPEMSGRSRHAGVGLFELTNLAPGVLEQLEQRGVRIPSIGKITHCEIFGIDDGVVSRPTEGRVQLFTHASTYVLEGVASALRDLELEEQQTGIAIRDRKRSFPELLFDALTRCRSRLGLSVLERQPERWASSGFLNDSLQVPEAVPPEAVDHAAQLRFLLQDARVIAIGAANAGKSTLLNALAKQHVSVVSDERGTTRDHVGVSLEIAGLSVRWLDTAGFGVGEGSDLNAQATTKTRSLIPQADVLVWCVPADASDPGELCPEIASDTSIPLIRCLTKTDLGIPSWATGWEHVSAHSGQGMERLVGAIRDALVPPDALELDAPWWFWQNGFRSQTL